MAAKTPEQENTLKLIEKHLEPMPFYVKEYVLAKKRAGLSPNTLLQYLYRFTHFFKWTLTEGIINAKDIGSIPYTMLEKMEKETILIYLDTLKEENISKTTSTVKTRGKDVIDLSIHALKALFNYLTVETENEDGECYFDRNVMSKIVLKKKSETANNRARQINSVILNDEEITEYLHFIEYDYVHTLENDNQLRSYERNGLRDLAINALILGTGLRVGEIASAEINNVNLRKRTISVTRKGDKPDTVLIMKSAVDILERYMKERTIKFPKAANSPFLFVTNYQKEVRPLTRRAIQKLVDKYTAAFSRSSAGISPHKLRHSFAADYIRNGGSIVLLRDQLGHNDIKTTSLYTNLSDADSLKVLDDMDKKRSQTDK